MEREYRSTIVSCYISNVATSFAASAPPLMFVAMMDMYDLSFEQLGRLILISFLTQMASDLMFARPVDRYGVRPFIVLGHALAFVGMVLYGLTPYLFPGREYAGLVLAVVVGSVGGGLHELLLSPILSAVPMSEEKRSGAMTMLHSFFAWGNVCAIIATTLLLAWLGQARWNWILLLWSALPMTGLVIFCLVPLAPMVPEERRTKAGELLKSRVFLSVLLAIAVGGAAEVSMSQWASSFCEVALKLPKLFGDVAGVCMFSVMLGIGRSLYGKFSAKLPIERAMKSGAIATVACFVVAALSPWPVLSLAACALSGLGVSLLWPGSVVLATKAFPLAGASMFALMSAGGDTGGALGPWLVGLLADAVPGSLARLLPGLTAESLGLRVGILAATLFPLGMIACLNALGRANTARSSSRNSKEVNP